MELQDFLEKWPLKLVAKLLVRKLTTTRKRKRMKLRLSESASSRPNKTAKKPSSRKKRILLKLNNRLKSIKRRL